MRIKYLIKQIYIYDRTLSEILKHSRLYNTEIAIGN